MNNTRRFWYSENFRFATAAFVDAATKAEALTAIAVALGGATALHFRDNVFEVRAADGSLRTPNVAHAANTFRYFTNNDQAVA